MSDTIAIIRRHHTEGEAEGFYRAAPKFRQVHDDRAALLLIVDRLEKKLAAVTTRANAAEAIVNAAQCIQHWHDAHNDGMIVSGEHVRKLWRALGDYEEQKP